MSADAAIDDFKRDLNSCLELRDMTFASRFDDAFRAKGRLIYALDAAVLKQLFSATAPKPFRRDTFQVFMGPSSDPSLQKDLEAKQTALKAAIYWTLLEDPPTQFSGSPFVLLPGHDLETRLLYDGVVKRFGRQRGGLSEVELLASQIRRAIGRSDDNTTQRQALYSALYKKINEIRQPHVLLSRFNKILRDHRISGFTGLSKQNDFETYPGGKTIGEIWKSVQSDVLDGRGLSTVSWWANTLHGLLPDRYLENDELALSTLDRLNRQLDPQKVRVVLITNNDLLLRAGEEYRPFEGVREDYLSESSFSDLYLRHAKSLLLEPDFLRPTTPGSDDIVTSEVYGWITALLAEISDQFNDDRVTYPSDKVLEIHRQWRSFKSRRKRLASKLTDESVEAALRRKPDIHSAFVARWSEYVDNLRHIHAAKNPTARTIIDEAVDLASANEAVDVRRLVQDFRTELKRLTENSWDDFFSTVTVTGLELIDISSEGQRKPTWPTPSLYLRGRSVRQEALKALWRPERLRDDPDSVLNLLDTLKATSSPPNRYTYTLCYGVMFAMAGRWTLTKLLAQRAVQISKSIELYHEQGSIGADLITGREANYLLAVATRVTARDEADLDEAVAALDAAVSAPDDAADDGHDGPVRTGLRVDAERASIALARLMKPEFAATPFASPFMSKIRQQLLMIIKESSECEQEHIRQKVNISVRSDYFFSLLFESRGGGSLDSAQATVVRHLVADQLSDIKSVYDDGVWLPLRDLRLLQLGASVASEQLPAALVEAADIDVFADGRRHAHPEWAEQREVENAIAVYKMPQGA